MDIMKQVGIEASVIKAGLANMFLSPIFRQTLANVSDVAIELYNTDGAQGAARGAALGVGFYNNPKEAYVGLERLMTIEPQMQNVDECQTAYRKWLKELNRHI